MELPTDFSRPAMQSYEGNHISVEIHKELVQSLRKVSKNNPHSTMFHLLFAAFNVLLSKISMQEDIVVGVPVSGRSHADVENMIGMFVNTLALRNKPERTKTFKQFLDEVTQQAIQAHDHQDYPLEDLINKLDLPRDTSRSPLFDTTFNMLNVWDAERTSTTLFEPYDFEMPVSKFDMTFILQEGQETISLGVEYSTKLFKQETIERLVRQYVHLLHQIVEEDGLNTKLADLKLEEESIVRQFYAELNPNVDVGPIEMTLTQIFEEQVRRTPHHLAVIYQDSKLTYCELNERVNILANKLRDLGVGPNHVVGLMVERSTDMLVGILGILKAGGAYVPIDPSYPSERIAFILQDSGASILVGERDLITEKIMTKLTDMLVLDISTAIEEGLEDESLKSDIISLNQPTDLAYVIYTSGTTGQPKGVMIEHRNVLNLLRGLQQEVYDRFAEPIRVALVAPYVFDASVQQIFAALLYGHTLYVLDEETRMDGYKMVQFFEQHRITLSDGTPAHFSMIANVLANKEVEEDQSTVYPHFLIGGDQLTKDLVQKVETLLRQDKLRITNVYGPTECTVDATICHVHAEDIQTSKPIIPIGRPLPNVEVFVLDEGGELLPPGAIGELCIAGAGVARGYLNRPELTREKFVAHPYRPGETMYRSGDLARWTTDGKLEFFGRLDTQLKVRGYRIEAGEIESHLRAHELVEQAVVIGVKVEDAHIQLAAYYTAQREVREKELRQYLRNYLPDYMIPTYFVQLEEIPLTVNGKLDRKALPEPKKKIAADMLEMEKKTENMTELEAILVQICEQIFRVDRVLVEEDFYAMGADSLMLVELQTRIQHELGYHVPMKTILMHSSVRRLAAEIEKESES